EQFRVLGALLLGGAAPIDAEREFNDLRHIEILVQDLAEPALALLVCDALVGERGEPGRADGAHNFLGRSSGCGPQAQKTKRGNQHAGDEKTMTSVHVLTTAATGAVPAQLPSACRC